MATRSRNTSWFNRNHQQDPAKLYKDILKDVKKMRNYDAKDKHNAHPTEEEILSNLPQNLKQFSHTLYIVHEFWLNNIQCLNDDELNEIALSLYCHLYNQTDTNVHQLLLKSNKMDIPAHILKIFTIFEYAIHLLIDSSTDSHIKLLKQLKSIGDIHKDIDYKIYELILDAFNHCFEHKFEKLFSMETSFCFNQFYGLIVDIMNDLDNVYLSQYLKQIDCFLDSFKDCLSHKYGSIYFKKFLEQQFQHENYLFYKAVEEYKSVGTKQRVKIGTNIINTFIKQNSDFQVNLRGSKRKHILTLIELTNKMDENDIIKASKEGNININNIQDIVYSQGFTEHLFDKAQQEIFNLMQRNSWNEFRDKILEYCGDNEFVKEQENKPHKSFLKNDNEDDEQQKRELIIKLKQILMNDEKSNNEPEIDILKQENLKLQNQIINLKSNESKIDILKQENSTLQNEITNLERKQSEIQILKQNNDTLQDEIINLKKGLSEIEILKEKNSKLHNEITILKTNESEIQILKQNRDKLDKEIIDLKQRLSEIEILKQNNDDLQKEITNLKRNESEIEILKESNDELQKEIMNLKNNEEKLIHSKIELIKSTATEIDSLRRKIKIYTKSITDHTLLYLKRNTPNIQ